MQTDISILLLGNTGAGKSYYLFSLGLALKQHPTLKGCWKILGLDDAYEQQIQEWKQQHQEKGKIDKTPLSTCTQFSFDIENTESKQTYRIILIDRAAEDILRCEEVTDISPDLTKSSWIKGAILLLMDIQFFEDYGKCSNPEESELLRKKHITNWEEWLKKFFSPTLFQSFCICLMKADICITIIQEKLLDSVDDKELHDKLPRWIKNDIDSVPLSEMVDFISKRGIEPKYHYISALGLCKGNGKLPELPEKQFAGFNVFGPILDAVEDVDKFSKLTFVKEQELELLKQELGDKNKILEPQKIELQKLTQEIVRLQEEVQQQKDLNEFKKIKLDSLQNELNDTLVNYKKSQEEINRLTEELQKQKVLNSTVQSQLDSLRSELEQAIQEKEKTKKREVEKPVKSNSSDDNKPKKEASVKTARSKTEETEETYRQRCEEAASIGSPRELTIFNNKQNKPYESPQPGDIIVHGSLYPEATKGFESVYLGSVANISLFSQFSNYFTPLNQTGHVWFSFSDSIQDNLIVTPPWTTEHPNTIPFWQRWCDLLKWAILSPEAYVFMEDFKGEKLSENRAAICQKLFDLHKNFDETLSKSDYYPFIGKDLHKAYSAFYQFLLSEDLNPDEVPKHVFVPLRQSATENVKNYWQPLLGIEESHAIGILTEREYLSSVQKDTEHNMSILKNHSLLLGSGKKFEGTQVLYWLKPRWQLKEPPNDQPPELLGQVLFYSEV